MRSSTKSTTKGRRVNTGHHVRQPLDPGGDLIQVWEVEASAREASRKIFDPLEADWAYRVHGDPEIQSDGFMVYDRKSGREDSWHRWADDAERRKWALRDEQYVALRDDQARHCPHQARLLEAVPVADEPDPIDRLSREWDLGRAIPDWHLDLLADIAALGDDEERFEIAVDFDWDWRSRELYEAKESERVVGRASASRMDAEEEARMYYGYSGR